MISLKPRYLRRYADIARLLGPREVAVKVQRPGIRRGRVLTHLARLSAEQGYRPPPELTVLGWRSSTWTGSPVRWTPSWTRTGSCGNTPPT